MSSGQRASNKLGFGSIYDESTRSGGISKVSKETLDCDRTVSADVDIFSIAEDKR